MSADYKTAHTVPVMLSMGMLITAVSLGAFAILAPESSIRPFLIVLALVLTVVSIIKMFDIAMYESRIEKLHKSLAVVEPESCPDYWMTEFSKCFGRVCRPYFDGVDMNDKKGSVRMVQNVEDAFTLGLMDHKSKPTDIKCNESSNSQYPWMELSNQCNARNKVAT